MTEDELLEEYELFMEEFEPTIYEVTDANRAIVKEIDPSLVWTYHSTCENEMLSPGFSEYRPDNCCWHEQAWYVSEKPWDSDESSQWIQMSASLPCPECNKDGESDEGSEDCPVCDGDGYYQFYVD